MRSPLGFMLANLLIHHFEQNWLQSCLIEFKPVMCRRYIDDILVL